MRTRLLLGIWAVLVVAGWVAPRPPRVDLGALRVVVLQSDDWGLEAWFPDEATADVLADLATSVPARLRAYARSGLERADEVTALSESLAAHRDADGLPWIVQANTILRGPSLQGWNPEAGGWPPLHPSGEGSGPYARPGLRAAVDTAIARGVWYPELHGLTHFDLDAYGRARRAGDPMAARSAVHGVLAYDGWTKDSELEDADPERARRIASWAHDAFVARFGRAPVSVIAPDYRWGPEDEAAWAEIGLRVVQAKREQVDSRLRPGSVWGRVRKVWRRWRDRRSGRFTYLDRPARLEPYGSADPSAAQGAREAAEAVRRAWKRGRPGIVSIHRVQLVSFDPEVARAGWSQLAACLRDLEREGPVRLLVDDEVDQLLRRGWSRLRRGRWEVLRNLNPHAVGVGGGEILPGRTVRVRRIPNPGESGMGGRDHRLPPS